MTLDDPPVDESRAEILLRFSCQTVLGGLQRPGLVLRAPSRHQAAALLSLAYNIGVGCHDGVKGDLADSSLLACFNRGDIQGAAAHFADWDKARIRGVLTVLPGLAARRAREAQLFRTPDDAMA